MAGEVEKLSGKLGIDTTDFKTAIGAANRELRVLETSFKAGAAALGDWSRDASGLESRMKTLTSQIDIQKLKVDALRAEHQRLADENGNNSRAAQDAEIKLNKETETLNKMTLELQTTSTSLNEMRESTDDTGGEVEDLGNKSVDAGGKLDALKGIVSGVGAMIETTVGVVLGLAGAVAAVGGAISGMMFSAAEASGQLVDLSAKTGIPLEQLQEWAFIGDQVGTSLDTITGAQARLVRSMASGRDGPGDQADAFSALGVSITDANGNLRDTQDVFADVIDSLGQVENPAERDALAMTLFGKSAQELNPLILEGSDGLQALAEKAHDVGAVMSDENVEAFAAFDDTLASLKAGLKGTVGELLATFLPGFQAVFDQVGGYLQTFKDIVDTSDGDFGKIAEGLSGLFTQIASDLAKQIPQMMDAGLAIVQSILDAITQALPQMLDAAIAIINSLIGFLVANLPTMLNAAITILSTLVGFLVANLPTLIDAGVQILLMLVNAIIANLPMLVDAAVQAIIALANGLAEALPILIPSIVGAIITIVQTLTQNIPLLIEAALALMNGLADGLIVALPVLIAAIPPLIQGLLTAWFAAGPQIAKAGGELVGKLAYGILSNIGVLAAGIAELLVIIGKTLLELPKLGFQNAQLFIQGMVDGLQEASGMLYDVVSGIIEDMLSAITDMLGIASPSKVGRGYGRNFITSMALGGLDSMREVERSFAVMAGRLTVATEGGLGLGTSNVQNTDNFQFFSPVIIQGSTPADSLGAILKGKRF